MPRSGNANSNGGAEGYEVEFQIPGAPLLLKQAQNDSPGHKYSWLAEFVAAIPQIPREYNRRPLSMGALASPGTLRTIAGSRKDINFDVEDVALLHVSAIRKDLMPV